MPFFSKIAELDIGMRVPEPFADLGAMEAIAAFYTLVGVLKSALD